MRRALLILGPGFLAGASDDDPSGIGTYAQAGASFGYSTLWMLLLMFPMMTAVQYISAKVGLVTGRGLAGALRQQYPRPLLYAALLGLAAANTLNAGADIGAIAAAINLLLPVPALALVIPVGLGIAVLQLFGSYSLIVRVFRWLTLALLAYLATVLFTHPDVGAALAGTFIPVLKADPAYIGLLVALLGTTISPYLFFWQASQEVDEQVAMGRRLLWQRRGASKLELRGAFLDTAGGMAFSELVGYAIVFTAAATLFTSGHRQVSSAADAARALQPLAGDLASALLALGLIGTGVLAVPILTGSAAYALSDTFGWNASLDKQPAKAPRFYTVIVVATIVGIAINFTPGLNAISALVIAAAINGVVAAPLLILLMVVSNDRRVMGTRTNGRLLNAVGWATAGIMSVAAVALLVITFLG